MGGGQEDNLKRRMEVGGAFQVPPAGATVGMPQVDSGWFRSPDTLRVSGLAGKMDPTTQYACSMWQWSCNVHAQCGRSMAVGQTNLGPVGEPGSSNAQRMANPG